MLRALGARAGLGLRAGVGAAPDLHSDFFATGAAGETGASTERMSFTLAPVLLGLRAGRAPAAGFRLTAGVWAGPVFAAVTDRYAWSFADPNTGDESSVDSTATGRGAGLGFEADLEAGWGWRNGLTAFVAVGRRAGRVKALRHTRDADLDGDGVLDARKGDPLTDVAGRRLTFDLGGTTARAGLRLAL